MRPAPQAFFICRLGLTAMQGFYFVSLVGTSFFSLAWCESLLYTIRDRCPRVQVLFIIHRPSKCVRAMDDEKDGRSKRRGTLLSTLV